MKTLVGAFNQEKALVGVFSVIVKTGCGTDGSLHRHSISSDCAGHIQLSSAPPHISPSTGLGPSICILHEINTSLGGSFIENKWRWFCTVPCHEVRQKFMTHYVKHSGLKSQWSWVLISWAGGCLTWCGPVIIPGPGHLHSIHTISSNSKLSLLFWMDFAYPLSSSRKWSLP